MRGVKKFGEHVQAPRALIYSFASNATKSRGLRALLNRMGQFDIRTVLNASDLDFTVIWLLI